MPVLACIQFFRVIVGTQDEFYLRYLVKNSLFKPVVELLVANGSRYNLLNSALLVRLPPLATPQRPCTQCPNSRLTCRRSSLSSSARRTSRRS